MFIPDQNIDESLFEELSREEDNSIEKLSFYIVDKTFQQERLASYLTEIPESTYLLERNFYRKLPKQTSFLPKSKVSHIVYLREKISRRNEFVLMQKWEGVVLEIKKDSFIARLVDLMRKGVEEEAELLIDEVSSEDRKLIKPGVIFYWNIGYLDSLSGQRTRSSIIRFRRLPAWNKKEIEKAESEATLIRESIGWK